VITYNDTVGTIRYTLGYGDFVFGDSGFFNSLGGGDIYVSRSICIGAEWSGIGAIYVVTFFDGQVGVGGAEEGGESVAEGVGGGCGGG
jgi:hypothetical protein